MANDLDLKLFFGDIFRVMANETDETFHVKTVRKLPKEHQ